MTFINCSPYMISQFDASSLPVLFLFPPKHILVTEQVQRVPNPTFNANNVMCDESPVKHQYILWRQMIHDLQLPQYQLSICVVAPWDYRIVSTVVVPLVLVYTCFIGLTLVNCDTKPCTTQWLSVGRKVFPNAVELDVHIWVDEA